MAEDSPLAMLVVRNTFWYHEEDGNSSTRHSQSEPCSPKVDGPPGLQYAQSVSQGKQSHGEGNCCPCKWAYTPKGCQHGANCVFCHLPHPLGTRGLKARLHSNRRQQFATAVLTAQRNRLEIGVQQIPKFIESNPFLLRRFEERVRRFP